MIVDKSIIAENVVRLVTNVQIGMGVGEEQANLIRPDVYAFGLVTIGDDSVIPHGS